VRFCTAICIRVSGLCKGRVRGGADAHLALDVNVLGEVEEQVEACCEPNKRGKKTKKNLYRQLPESTRGL